VEYRNEKVQQIPFSGLKSGMNMMTENYIIRIYLKCFVCGKIHLDMS